MVEKIKVIGIPGNSQLRETIEHLDFVDKVITLDGHDNSDLPENGINLESIYNSAIEQIGDDKVILLGHSLGANIAHAISPYLNVKGLISFGSIPLNYDFIATAFSPIPAVQYFMSGDMSEEAQDIIIRDFANSIAGRQVVAKGLKNTDPLFRLQIGESIARGEMRDEIAALKAIECPILFINGKEDKILNTSLLKQIQIGESVEIEAGHMLQYDNPFEFNKACKDFIDKVTTTHFKYQRELGPLNTLL